MRRAGDNPTEVEVNDITNRLDDGTGHITIDDFCDIMAERNNKLDAEIQGNIQGFQQE